MNCVGFDSCIETQLGTGVAGLLYRSNLVFLLPFVVVMLGLGMWWRIMAVGRQSPWIASVRPYLSMAFLAALLLALPPAVARIAPGALYELVGIPTNISVFQLAPDALRWPATLVTWLTWFGLGGIVLQSLGLALSWRAAVYQPQAVTITRLGEPPKYGAEKSAEKALVGDIKEVTPLPSEDAGSSITPSPPEEGEESQLRSTRYPFSPSGAGASARKVIDPEATPTPDEVKAKQPGMRRYDFAWLELRRVGRGGFPAGTGWRKRRLVDRTLKVGRLSSRTDERDCVILPNTPDGIAEGISREQILVEPTATGYRLTNKGKAPVTVNGNGIPRDGWVMLQDGARIIIGDGYNSYELQFRQLGQPLLEELGPDGALWSVEEIPFIIGGPGSFLQEQFAQPVAKIEFQDQVEPPGYYLTCEESDLNVDVLVDGQPVGTQAIRLRHGIEFLVGDMGFRFRITNVPKPAGG